MKPVQKLALCCMCCFFVVIVAVGIYLAVTSSNKPTTTTPAATTPSTTTPAATTPAATTPSTTTPSTTTPSTTTPSTTTPAAPATPPPQPVNCVGAWSACSRTCGGLGQQLYNISTPASNGGTSCEAAQNATKNCMTPGCPNNTICSNDSECSSGYCDSTGDNYRCKDRPPPPQQSAAPSTPSCDCSMGAAAYRAAGCGKYGEDC